MLAFACPAGARLVTFESLRCLNCSSELGYEPEARTLVALANGEQPGPWQRCANAAVAACTWVAGR